MKNLLIAVIAIVTLASCTQTKVGYADTAKIQEEYKAIKDLKKELEDKTKQLQAKYEKLEADFQAKVNAYQKKGRPSKNQEQQLQAMYQQISMGYQTEVSALDKENKERLKAMIEDIKTFSEDFAKKAGYAYIMGVDGESLDLIYADKQFDVTNDLIDALNEDYKSGKKVEKAPVKEEPKSEAKEEAAEEKAAE
ncbi:MAG: hypothetical protein CSA40_00840 [Flavobacteriales bacterium]|nr:MAG: hypothetical protein CSA40_00840 [Flavobacteriales bacterium]